MTPLGIALIAPMVAPITDDDAPLGGAQALLADLARGLVAAGHRVTLLAARGSGIAGACCPDLGIDTAPLRDERLLTTASVTTHRATPAQRAAFRAARRWLDQHRGEVDVVHATPSMHPPLTASPTRPAPCCTPCICLHCAPMSCRPRPVPCEIHRCLSSPFPKVRAAHGAHRAWT